MYIYREESLSEKGALNKHFFPITIWKDMYMCILYFPNFPFVYCAIIHNYNKLAALCCIVSLNHFFDTI